MPGFSHAANQNSSNSESLSLFSTQTLRCQTNHIASLSVLSHREIRNEKLTGGALSIKSQQQAVWSPLSGDMRKYVALGNHQATAAAAAEICVW